MRKIMIWLLCLGAGLSILDREYYKILRVPISAGPEEIKDAYRRMSRKYHPDRNPNSRSRFEKINVAYETLSNPEQKLIYDRVGHEKMKDPNIQQEKNLHSMKGDNLEVKLSLTLEDLYQGKELTSTIFKYMACPHCQGSGAQNPYDIVRCAQCQGQGKKMKRVAVGGGYYNMVSETCPRCGGEGKIVGRKCSTCSGNKLVAGSQDFTVKIAPGTRHNEILHYINMGEEKLEGAPGDLLIRVHEIPHQRFSRRGHNLHTSLTISLEQALRGFEREIRQLDGRELPLSSKGITQPGQTFHIQGEGMPILGSDQKGDLFVTVNVVIPPYEDSQRDQLLSLMASFK